MDEEAYFTKLHKEEYEEEYPSEYGTVSVKDRTPKAPKEKYLPWEKFYMSVAYLASQRSEDPNTKV